MGGRKPLDAAGLDALLSHAPSVAIAAVVDGAPLLRSLHHAWHDGVLYVHGGRTGEKAALAGARVVAQAEQIVARVPSWMRDPVRACPATTFYRSALLVGRLHEVHAAEQKATSLQALMERLQPEGGHAPIRTDDTRYAKALHTTRVLA